jgi:hypothetical protein
MVMTTCSVCKKEVHQSQSNCVDEGYMCNDCFFARQRNRREGNSARKVAEVESHKNPQTPFEKRGVE